MHKVMYWYWMKAWIKQCVHFSYLITCIICLLWWASVTFEASSFWDALIDKNKTYQQSANVVFLQLTSLQHMQFTPDIFPDWHGSLCEHKCQTQTHWFCSTNSRYTVPLSRCVNIAGSPARSHTLTAHVVQKTHPLWAACTYKTQRSDKILQFLIEFMH